MKRLATGLVLLGFMLLWTVDVSSQQPGPSPTGVRLPCITKEPRLPDGTEVDCDFPATRHRKNIGGSDGAGLCVGTANGMQFDWHHIPGYPDHYQAYLHKFPGGSWTDKASQQIAEFAKSREGQECGAKAPEILHNTNGDIELQVAALKSGHMPSTRIIRSPAGRYGGQSIDHMVNLLGARCYRYAPAPSGGAKSPINGKWYAEGQSMPVANTDIFCIYDNNFPGTYEWCTEADWKRTHAKWTMYCQSGTAPPPIPSPNK